MRYILKRSIVISAVLFLGSFATVHASCDGGADTFSNPLKFCTLADFLNELLNVIIIIGIPIVTLAIIYAGFLFISAQGNETKISSAKKIFFWVVIGSLLILGAKALAVAIEGTVEDLGVRTPENQMLTLEEDSEIYKFVNGSA